MSAKQYRIYVLEEYVSIRWVLLPVSVHLDRPGIQQPIDVKIRMNVKMNIFVLMADVLIQWEDLFVFVIQDLSRVKIRHIVLVSN